MKNELENILEKAHFLYLKYGIKSVSMDDVARELAMSKKTLYQYVKDKKDLVRQVIGFESKVQLCKFENSLSDNKNAIEELIMVNTFVKGMLKEKSFSFEFDLEKYYPDLFKELSDLKQKKMFNNIFQNIEKGKKEGIYRNDFKSEIIAGLYMTRISSSHFFEFLFNQKTKHDEIHREIVIYHIRGIANSKGIEILEEKIKNTEI